MQRPASRRIPHPRRDFLGIGGLSALGLSIADLTACGAGRRGLAAGPARAARAKSCMILFLAGGPPQHETFDPKPDAPGEIRGEFRPSSTNVPGIQFCELLPLTARHADKMCVIRSMTTGIHSHSASGAFMLTGLAPQNLAENVPASPQDWPSIAATVGALRPATRSPLSSVILPEPIVNNPAIPWPGQDGGFMGGRWHPQLLRCDPAAPHIEIDGLESPAELASGRLEDRRRLLDRLDARFREAQANPAMHDLDHMHHQAFSLLDAGRTRDALQIERETAAVRDRYGRHKFGQSVLLGRRLLEAGVRLVQVNYPREPGDTTASNPLWDTHADNAARLRDVLCPSFDQPFAALLEDLASSGMLAETLVVVMGEFGRTPKINARGGRDHWGSVFSVALAGGCVPGGAVIGASDRLGAMPAERPVRPADLAATIFQLLGIPPGAEFHDSLGRPRAVTNGGTPLREIVG